MQGLETTDLIGGVWRGGCLTTQTSTVCSTVAYLHNVDSSFNRTKILPNSFFFFLMLMVSLLFTATKARTHTKYITKWFISSSTGCCANKNIHSAACGPVLDMINLSLPMCSYAGLCIMTVRQGTAIALRRRRRRRRRTMCV